MTRIFLTAVLSLFAISVFSQDHPWRKEVENFQSDLESSYRNPQESPLKGTALKKFKGHMFYPINPRYRVKARLVRTENAPVFNMPTTGSPAKFYEYGKLYFFIGDVEYRLNTYVSVGLQNDPEYADYLFLPFGDLSNGNETYSGGRYIDFRIPTDTNEIFIDFNRAYNPYCAYATGYSCPKVPNSNILPLKIEAGILAPIE